jgi:hypothetical protein
MDAEKKAQADALLRQAAQGVPDVSEDTQSLKYSTKPTNLSSFEKKRGVHNIK